MRKQEIQIFTESLSLPPMEWLGEDLAFCAIENVGELHIAAENGGKSCLYLLMDVENITVDILLKGLALCDLRKLVGMPQNFTADEEGRVGFLVRFPDNDPNTPQLARAFQQILQSHSRLIEQ